MSEKERSVENANLENVKENQSAGKQPIEVFDLPKTEIEEKNHLEENFPKVAYSYEKSVIMPEPEDLSKKKNWKKTGIIAIAAVVSILLLIIAFGSSSYEKTIKNVCRALESGNQRKIERLLFDREPMKKGALDALFDDLEYYYGKGYEVTCQGMQLVDEADSEDFELLTPACERLCMARLKDEVAVTGDTKLGELDAKQELLERVQAFTSEEAKYRFLAQRYGAKYPVDISRFENCKAYYVKARIVISDKEGDQKDEITVYFTIIQKGRTCKVDRAEGAGIAEKYVGSGYLHTACDDALLKYNELFFRLDELLN